MVLPDRTTLADFTLQDQTFAGGNTLAWEIKLFQRLDWPTTKTVEAVRGLCEFCTRLGKSLLSPMSDLDHLSRESSAQYKNGLAQAELIIADLFAFSMTPDGVLSELRRYIKIKQELDHHLQFDQACEIIYNQTSIQSSRTLLLLFSRQPWLGCGL